MLRKRGIYFYYYENLTVNNKVSWAFAQLIFLGVF